MLRSAPCYLLILLFVSACQPSDSVDAPQGAEAAGPPAELTDQLPAGAGPETIAAHLLEAEHTATPTRALAIHYPVMSREEAYQVQLSALGQEASQGGRLIGWKLGGTRVADPSGSPDPSFAYILASDSLADGQRLNPDAYVGDSVLVEAEVAFVMGRDLPGPRISEAELIDGIESVAGAIELISVRLLPGPGGVAPSTDMMIAARLSHAGVILTEERLGVSEIELASERARAEVDGVEMASGAAHQIMNSSPLDALLWLANALPEHGLYLRAGDIVITGSMYDNPTLKAGQTAVVQFTSLGELSVSLGE